MKQVIGELTTSDVFEAAYEASMEGPYRRSLPRLCRIIN
jgi:hypothetical protein